jgi:two-component system chemotaxis sensor kinase CheA
MDTSEYMTMFLAESREHLDALNLAVIRIEETPDDRDTLDEIFRTAHSLKGMSATMGFAQIAALTHKMEDVFEVLRGRTEGVDRSAIDVLLECLDALSGAVESIAEEGAESLDPSGLIVRLESLLLEEGAAAAAAEAQSQAAAMPSIELLEGLQGVTVAHVRAELVSGVMMPSVRAYMVLAALGDHGELVGSVPTAEAVDSFEGAVIEAWLATDHEHDAISKTVLGVPDVGTVSVSEHGAQAEAPVQAAEAAPAEAGAGAAAKTPANRAEPGRKAAATVRVDADRLDQLMHLMGELVVNRTTVESLAGAAQVDGLSEAVQDLTRSSQALQALVMRVRMIPVEAVFLRFPRLVRDLSSKFDKQVELVLTGQETELDRTVVDMLGDPLVHLVRNSLDHALEMPEERRAAGKPETGTLEISARHAGSNVVITVRDDGRGVDPSRVAKKALERGLISADQVAEVDMDRAIELLFSAGFSTADTTSDISGRGVGMDAVRNAIRELGGAVQMTSELGAGTTVHIRLPLTLAIMPALLTESNGTPLAIPLERVERTLNLADQVVRSVTGRRMLVLSDGVLPLLELGSALGYPSGNPGDYVVIVRGAEQRLALAVSHLVGQRELVTRPLPSEVGDGLALSGGAVLSDGSIALIVDCDALAEQSHTSPVTTNGRAGNVPTLAQAA